MTQIHPIYTHLPLLLGASALGLVGKAERDMPLVVLVELHKDNDEADELDGIEDETNGEGDLFQDYGLTIHKNHEWQP